jgi:AAA family ATP:ADP antiporter
VLDSSALLLAANLPLAASIALTTLADHRGPTGEGSHPLGERPVAAAPAPADTKHVGALELVYRHRYLLAVAGVTLLTHWVSTNGDNLLFRVVQEALANEVKAQPGLDAHAVQLFVREGTTAFYGSFFFWVNVCALFLQAFCASRLLEYGGFGPSLLLLPMIALSSYSAMAFLPFLLVVRVMKTAESSTSYSINNTAQQVLWLPTTSEMKYKAKPAIETFVVRLGDGLAAMTVLVGVRLYALSTESLFLFNVGLVLLWLLIAWFIVREYHRIRARTGAPPT